MMHARFLPAFVFAAALFIPVLSASASTTQLSTDPSYANGPMQFYCSPYTNSFMSGGSYEVTFGNCTYTVPGTLVSTSTKTIELYYGPLGSAYKRLYSEQVANPATTRVQEDYVNLIGANDGDDFFAVEYDDTASTTQLTNYFMSGGPVPDGLGTHIYVLPWKIHVLSSPDTTPPSITIATPQDGSHYLTTDSVVPQVTITDDSGSTIAQTYTLNGISVSPSSPLPFTVGIDQFVVSATDPSGNVGYATSTFQVAVPDTQPPSITITLPQNGATYFSNASVTPAVTISDNSGSYASATYMFDGSPVDPTTPLPLSSAPQGSNMFVVSATDAAGNVGYATSTFTVQAPAQNTPPEVNITSPLQNGVYARSNTVYLTANITDASGVVATHYYLDGTEINGSQPLPLSSAKIGRHTVKVTATDSAGLTGSDSLSFIVVGSANSCVMDIVSILTGIRNRDWPDKPTLAQMLQDCSALARSLHRFDDDGSHGGDHQSHYFFGKPSDSDFSWHH